MPRFIPILTLAVFAVAGTARADQAMVPVPPDPALANPECVTTTTTTTTTRCTGNAAPLAAPPAPGATLVPEDVAVPTTPPRVIVLDARNLERDDWHLVHDPDGSLWRERRISSVSTPLLGVGLSVLVGSWLAGAVATSDNNGRNVGVLGIWPILGPFINAADNDSYGGSHSTAMALYTIDGLLQAGGFVLTLVSLGAGPEKVERQPVHLGAMPLVGGAGISATGSF